MPVTIEQLPIETFNISMSKIFNVTESLENYHIQIGKHKEKGVDSVMVLLKYNYDITSIAGKGDLQFSFTIPYILYPLTEIVIKDLYDCILIMRITIKEIVDVIFRQHEYIPEVSIYSFLEMEEELSTFLSSLKTLE